MVHESLHPYCGPWVNRHLENLKKPGRALFALLSDIFKKEAYGTFTSMLDESMVRAYTVRYLRDHDLVQLADKSLRQDEAEGFLWVRDLADLLGSTCRAKETDLDALAPVVGTFLEAWTEKAPAAVRLWRATRTGTQRAGQVRKK